MRGLRNCLLWVGLLVALSAVPAHADFAEGMAAYEAGDFETALAEWQPLADQGSAPAQFNLGLLYFQGKGVDEDHEQAAKWFLLAAEAGFLRAQYRIAGMYERGEGVEQDSRRALMWYSLAAKQRYRDARKQKKRLAKTMTPHEISYAEMYVRQWRRDREQQSNKE